MERPDRTEKDDTQKAKLIFFSLAALVTILLIWSFYTANNARHERDQARQDIELVKQDNAKLEQMLKDQNQITDELKKKLQLCEEKLKAKPVVKKPVISKKTTKKRRLNSLRPFSESRALPCGIVPLGFEVCYPGGRTT
jgi:septal ring factor EnvC (AmiA/AmiB activator)